MLKRKILEFLVWLSVPDNISQDLEQQHNARIVARVLLVFIPIGLFITAAPALLSSTKSVWQDWDFVVMVMLCVPLLIGYFLSRSGRVHAAVTFSSVLASAGVFVSVFNLGDYDGIHTLKDLDFLIMPILMSSLFLSSRLIVFLSVLDLLSILCVPVVFPWVSFSDIVRPLSFVLIALVLGLLSSRHRDWLEGKRQNELRRSNAFIAGLNQVATHVSSANDPSKVIETLGAELKRLGMMSMVLLLDSETQVLRLVYTSIAPKAMERARKLLGVEEGGFQITLTQWPTRDVILKRRPVMVADPVALTQALFPDASVLILDRLLHVVGVLAAHPLIHLPMMVDDRVLGLLGVWGAGLQESDIPALSAFAGQISVTIQNTHLYAEIKQSLAEKDVLLKEIHHRVKNNLQVISSLLSLQSRSVRDTPSRELFMDSQQRVRSMAMIHEQLYQSTDLASVDFVEYIESLTRHLFRSYRVSVQAVKLHLNVEPVFLDINTAIPCGLILNELISNALKYAFPGGREGEIRVALFPVEDSDTLTLVVADNGVGLPEDLDPEHTDSLGLQLVYTLVEQLEGSLTLHRHHGTEFRITFAESVQPMRS